MNITNINFLTPVLNDQNKKSQSKKKPDLKLNALFDAAERYFDIGSKRYRIQTLGNCNGTVKHEDESQSWATSALKIASFFTVVVPLFMLTAKCVCRYKYAFYDVNQYKVNDVRDSLRALSSQGKKIGLFIGKTATETLPKDDKLIWVSLDLEILNDMPADSFNTGRIAPDRLHLKMDFNDQKKMDELRYLFDKVVVDASTWKFVDDKGKLGNSLRRFHSLLKQKPSSEITIHPEFRRSYATDITKPEYGISSIKFPWKSDGKKRTEKEAKKQKEKEAEYISDFNLKLKDRFDEYFGQTDLQEGRPFPYKNRDNVAGYLSAKSPLKM
jgi:hypothetical protein